MKKNMGMTDRVIRVALALAVAVLIFTGQIAGPVGVVLGLFALVFLVTGMVGFCPLYLPLGISTRKEAVSQPGRGGPAGSR